MSRPQSPILVVDDDPDIRASLQQVLRSMGYATLEAAGAAEALRLTETEGPGLILLDMLMPGESGWDFIAKQRANPRIASLPVIVISACGKQQMSPPEGVQGYLPKPFEVDALLALVSKLLPPQGHDGGTAASNHDIP